jgi:hypothetical protein
VAEAADETREKAAAVTGLLDGTVAALLDAPAATGTGTV